MVSAHDSGASGPGSSPAGDIVLCSWHSWARHFTLTMPLSTQVYKWVPANCWGKLWESDLRWTSVPSRGSRNTSSRFTWLPQGRPISLQSLRLSPRPFVRVFCKDSKALRNGGHLFRARHF